MFARAQNLYASGNVGDVTELGRGYTATVRGTKPYHVSVSARHIDEGYCDCYMGENDMLCKHMLALGLAVLDQSGKSAREKTEPPANLEEVKRIVTAGMRKLRAYTGSSRVWFNYQRKLATGAGMISDAIQNLPPSEENAKYLWALVLKISKKLAYGGIDDSNGVVGDCAHDIVCLLGSYTKDTPKLKPLILSFCDDDTGFGFEDELRALLAQCPPGNIPATV